MMWRCNRCGTVTDEWDLNVVRDEYDCCYYKVCPECQCTDMDEVMRCDVCDRYDIDDEINIYENIQLCSCCKETIELAVEEATNKVVQYYIDKLHTKVHRDSIVLAIHDITEEMQGWVTISKN